MLVGEDAEMQARAADVSLGTTPIRGLHSPAEISQSTDWICAMQQLGKAWGNELLSQFCETLLVQDKPVVRQRCATLLKEYLHRTYQPCFSNPEHPGRQVLTFLQLATSLLEANQLSASRVHADLDRATRTGRLVVEVLPSHGQTVATVNDLLADPIYEVGIKHGVLLEPGQRPVALLDALIRLVADELAEGCMLERQILIVRTRRPAPSIRGPRRRTKNAIRLESALLLSCSGHLEETSIRKGDQALDSGLSGCIERLSEFFAVLHPRWERLTLPRAVDAESIIDEPTVQEFWEAPAGPFSIVNIAGKGGTRTCLWVLSFPCIAETYRMEPY